MDFFKSPDGKAQLVTLEYLNIVNQELKKLQLKTQSSFQSHKRNELVDFEKFLLPSLHHFRSQNSYISHNLAQLKWPVLRRNHKLLRKCC